MKVHRKNGNRNTNPDDGRDCHPVYQFRRGDVPDRVHFFRVDVFCFFERERVSRERRKREKTERDRRRRGKNDLEFETRDGKYLDHPGYLSPARTFVTLSSSMTTWSSFVPPSGARLRLQTFFIAMNNILLLRSKTNDLVAKSEVCWKSFSSYLEKQMMSSRRKRNERQS